MKTWMRRTLWGLLALFALLAALVALGLQQAERKLQRTIDVAVRAVPVEKTAQALDRGRYLYQSRGCADCHGRDGSGRVVIDDGSLHVAAPNITPSGVVAGYRGEDWVRTIRHGVKPDRRPLLVMPSEDYARLTDADLGALVAHVQSLAPASGRAALIELPLPVRLAYAVGMFKDGAEKVDHRLPPEAPVAEGVTIEHGRYVAQMCKGCHGADYAGGRIPGAPPDWPPAARLSAGADNAMQRYPDAESFKRMLQTGQRPDGSRIAVMPFESLREMSAVDAEALLLFLKSLAQPG